MTDITGWWKNKLPRNGTTLKDPYNGIETYFHLEQKNNFVDSFLDLVQNKKTILELTNFKEIE